VPWFVAWCVSARRLAPSLSWWGLVLMLGDTPKPPASSFFGRTRRSTGPKLAPCQRLASFAWSRLALRRVCAGWRRRGA
jgi:hypothetical protein